MCIKPVKPFGAGSSALCLRHQRAGIKITNRSNIPSIKTVQAAFVREISIGRTSLLPIFSTIKFGLALSSPLFIKRL